MTSSTLTGDRRWASARRGGMTVLGKVAVPKPINLPSQRLENHGMDPNVEIVPKGTLSWGSRSSSAGSNAWGTSAPSSSTDGGSSSPSHLVGRPSSSGGTRPSTAGSERAHDSNISAWGPNSRPSSASGVMASNHNPSATLRPGSADKRPGSSHLSRFAEPVPEGSGVWSATSAPEKVGVASSAKEGFSLSTGDFPTLGSEKDECKKNMESLDHPSHGRPGSSGGVGTMADCRGLAHADEISRNSDIRDNSWRKDGPSFVEDGPRPSMERWHGEPHLYPNPNMPPHYETWRGAPPVNPPAGVWFRGPPGPPYGGPVPPNGFPMEPFPYYHPHVPAPGLASSQQIPLGAGHHGHHPKNGDMPRRPHVPHIHPGMPMRPGFYPGPFPYDGYYRPPMGFGNPSDRDLPFMGMPAGPPVYSRHANQSAPDLNNSHPRSREGRGPEHVEHDHPHDPHGPYKVLMNPNDGWIHKEEEKWGHRMTTNVGNREKGILSKVPLQENAWGDDYKKDEDIHYGKNAITEASSINPSSLKFPERLSNINEAHMSPAMENVPYRHDHSLIRKIEGLNAKERAGVEKQVGFHMEGLIDKVQVTNPNVTYSDVIFEHHYPSGVLVPVPPSSDAPLADEDGEPTNASVKAFPRRSVRGAQSRGDPHATGRFHGQEADGRAKKIDPHPVLESGSRSISNDQVEDQSNTIMSNVDPNDMQRAKMREIAKQRAIQLQKEEEERVKEQKAKALAKLEELNRRSANLGTENSSQKETISPYGDAPKKREVAKNMSEPSVGDSQSTGSNSASFDNTAHFNERNTTMMVDSGVSSRHLDAETQRNTQKEDENSSLNNLSLDANSDGANGHKSAPQVREVSRQKRGGEKQKQYVPSAKNLIQEAIPFGSIDVLKDMKVASSTQEVGNLVGPRIEKEESESQVSSELQIHKKKVNKIGKNKHKIEEPSPMISSVPMHLEAKDAPQSLEIHATQNHDDTQGRVNNVWKSQHGRKPRNTQGSNRSSDKAHSNDAVIWAPVRSHNKLEVKDQMIQKSVEPLISSETGDNLVPNSTKTKRAEMERYVPKPVAKEHLEKGPQISVCDGWGDVVSDSKDHAPSGRGKRNMSKGQNRGGSHNQNLEHKESNAGLTDLQSSHVEAIQSERMSSKEFQPGGDHSSHWQPKQGNKSLGSQNIVNEESKPLKKESDRNEPRPSSGHRKNANHNGRFHYSSANRERQRQTPHYEYQPVGSYNESCRSNEAVVQTDDHQSGASRFRERGQGHAGRGRGNSYRRQSGNE